MIRLTADDRRRVIEARVLRIGPAVWLGASDGLERIPVRIIDFTEKHMARILISLPCHGQPANRTKLVCPSSLSLFGPGQDVPAYKGIEGHV